MGDYCCVTGFFRTEEKTTDCNIEQSTENLKKEERKNPAGINTKRSSDCVTT